MTVVVIGQGTATRSEPALTMLGIETERVREIRYTSAVEDGVRYVDVVDGNGEHVASAGWARLPTPSLISCCTCCRHGCRATAT
jgi:hypothetical protein